jgi:hypothetical protein
VALGLGWESIRQQGKQAPVGQKFIVPRVFFISAELLPRCIQKEGTIMEEIHQLHGVEKTLQVNHSKTDISTKRRASK